jgi:hypothetical protein
MAKTPTTNTNKLPTVKSGPSNIFMDAMNYLHNHVLYLNNSKFFAGCIMILLNIGSKFITIQFSRSTEEYLKMSVTKQILVFAMAWMGTRDIYAALGLTAVFVILSDHLFNEESTFCIVPENYRVLSKLQQTTDANNDGVISDDEINSAIAVLEKARKDNKQVTSRMMIVKDSIFDIISQSIPQM